MANEQQELRTPRLLTKEEFGEARKRASRQIEQREMRRARRYVEVFRHVVAEEVHRQLDERQERVPQITPPQPR